jgi:hypothetical protein
MEPRTGNPGRDDKGDGGAHLSSCYEGLRELSAEREANDPSIQITNFRGRNKSTLCHPERTPDFLLCCSQKQPRMRLSLKKAACGSPKPLSLTGNPEVAEGPAVPLNPKSKPSLGESARELHRELQWAWSRFRKERILRRQNR